MFPFGHSYFCFISFSVTAIPVSITSRGCGFVQDKCYTDGDIVSTFGKLEDQLGLGSLRLRDRVSDVEGALCYCTGNLCNTATEKSVIDSGNGTATVADNGGSGMTPLPLCSPVLFALFAVVAGF